MSFDTKDQVFDRPLPSDITLRVPVYRRRGVIASLIGALVAFRANRRLRWAARRHRSYRAPPIPDHLRADIGLPPQPQRLPNWWEQQGWR